MKFKSLLLTFSAFLVALVANGQIMEPVSWKQATVDNGDGYYLLQMTATIEQPFHMYDMGPYQDGPNPTTVTVTDTPGVELVDGIVASVEPKRKFDDGFGMEIGYFENSVTFSQRVKVTSADPVTLKINIEWQSCDDETCLPHHRRRFHLQARGRRGRRDDRSDTREGV